VLLTVTTLVASQNALNDGLSVGSHQVASSAGKDESRAPDPLLDLPPLQQKGASLIGGAVERVDVVRDHLVLRPFGGGKLEIVFDPRTQFIRGGVKADVKFLHPGDRIHVETILRGTQVFARTIYLPSETNVAEVSGQVMDYDAATGRLTIRDSLSSQPVRFTMASGMENANLLPGTLARIRFQPSAKGPVAQDIIVLAAPGSLFTFAGNVTYLDPESRLLVIANANDNKKYEIQFNPAQVEPKDRLREGVYASIAARFNGQGYQAERVTVLPRPAQ
jgi:hypothetical protein